MKSLIARTAFLATLAMLALARTAAAADPYPVRPITIVVPNAAGGPTDAVGRWIGQQLSIRLGQPVVIDNKGGAAGVIASEFVARAKPDGYTLMLATTGTQAINPALYEKLRYDVQKDFDPVGLISTSSNVLVVRTDLPVKDVRELIALAKREPGKLTYGSNGSGSSVHLAAEMFKTMTGTQITHVPYKAATALIPDLNEGRIDLTFAPESAAKDIVQVGKVRPLMVSGKARSKLFPQVPTAEEMGLKGYDVTIWFGLVAPAGTPAEAVDRLNKALAQSLAAPEFVNQLASGGNTPHAMTPQQFGTFLAQEYRKWAPVVKASGAKVE